MKIGAASEAGTTSQTARVNISAWTAGEGEDLMRQRAYPLTTALLLLVLAIAVFGCGDGDTRGTAAPSATSSATQPVATSIDSTTQFSEPEGTSTTTLPDRDATVARAIAQVQEALGLSEGSVTVSDKAARLPDADVLLSCGGEGEAELDLDTGRVVYLIPGPRDPDSGLRLPTEELDAKATRLAETMGWDAVALAAEGFTVEEAKLIDHGDAPTEYTKRWRGHDEQGIPNNGLIDAAVDASTGEVLHFFYNPGPRTSLDQSATIAEEEAVGIARAYLEGESWSGTSTTGSAATPGGGLTMQSAALVHTDAPGITGGREMLVWVLEFGGMTERGEATATVYLDAVTGKVLNWATAG
jgi:hypothetical protein